MQFLKGDGFDLIVSDSENYLKILNQENEGSQLGRLPLSKVKTNDAHNLILGIGMYVGGKEQRVIGRVSLEDINYINGTAELKIFMDNEFQKKGFGLKACILIINHAFNELNLRRIYSGTLANNEGFQKLADKLEMKKEGERIQAVYKNGEYLNVLEYGLLREV